MSFLRMLWILVLASPGSVTAEIQGIRITPATFTGAAQPQLAVAAGGTVHVVFGADGAVFHSRSADGRTFSLPVKIGALEKLALGMRRGPRVVVSGDFITVTAISHATGTVHGWTSPDEGATWHESGALNSVGNSACPMDGGSIVFEADGSLITTWRRESMVFTAVPGNPEILIEKKAAQPVIVRAGGELVIACEVDGSVTLRIGDRPPQLLGAGKSPSAAGNAKVTYVAWENDGALMLATVP